LRVGRLDAEYNAQIPVFSAGEGLPWSGQDGAEGRASEESSDDEPPQQRDKNAAKKRRSRKGGDDDRRNKRKRMGGEGEESEVRDGKRSRKKRDKGKGKCPRTRSPSPTSLASSGESDAEIMRRVVADVGNMEEGSYAYRAVRPETPQSVLRWGQAPCGRCPVFDFCKDGGPINPRECVYFEEVEGSVALRCSNRIVVSEQKSHAHRSRLRGLFSNQRQPSYRSPSTN
jgi:hypothetical protein